MSSASVSLTAQRGPRPDLADRLRQQAGSVVYNFARGVVKDARILVPKRTGYLASQIKWKRNGLADFTVYVDGNVNLETGAFYAVYVEHGTRHMAAQPFFRPAVEKNRRLLTLKGFAS